MADSRSIKIASWNVNGIRAVQKKGFADSVATLNPDILCLQETKISEDKLTASHTKLADYYSYWSFAAKKGYSGVGVYTRIEPKEVEHGFGNAKFDDEGRILVLSFDSFTLLNIYYPNSGQGPERLQYKMDFYEAFLEFITQRRKSGQNIIFCGDLNIAHQAIDLAQPERNQNSAGFLPCEREWVERLINQGYVDTFRHFNKEAGNYTWWDYRTFARDNNVGWRIDYFFVNKEILPRVLTATSHSDVLGSDHCPISIDIALD